MAMKQLTPHSRQYFSRRVFNAGDFSHIVEPYGVLEFCMIEHEQALGVGPQDDVWHWIERDESRMTFSLWSTVWYEEEIEGETGVL